MLSLYLFMECCDKLNCCKVCCPKHQLQDCYAHYIAMLPQFFCPTLHSGFVGVLCSLEINRVRTLLPTLLCSPFTHHCSAHFSPIPIQQSIYLCSDYSLPISICPASHLWFSIFPPTLTQLATFDFFSPNPYPGSLLPTFAPRYYSHHSSFLSSAPPLPFVTTCRLVAAPVGPVVCVAKGCVNSKTILQKGNKKQ